ncbi:PAXNEB-domain-containing protein [Wolfiporia cocos MD-104 SS10]|uniref:Elongator complex protein 4 n=1 Tax=Wolfiporia cocos (strain MD-104) TaxID=742152 RepID=A0A2H3IUY8_WOLCO|nr:PAXNEB-domain-containing protein [Wolfiporia cocos MD-104 SS10]
MSSFVRRTTSKRAPPQSGTRISPGHPSTIITSTGIPSLDDILGGGLPLSCSMLVLAPDAHSAYGELVQKYFVAQGLACGQNVCVVDDNADDFLAGCMWMPGSAPTATDVADEEDDKAQDSDAKIKIAWRYEQMKQFQTTVPASSQSAEDYCRVFDLTCRIPDSVLQAATASGQLVRVSIPGEQGQSLPSLLLSRISEALRKQPRGATPGVPVRICVPSLGSSQWGDTSTEEICYFLYLLRGLLRSQPYVCASISLPPHMCTDAWGGPGWVHKLSWLTDASITLGAFTANPALSALFPTYHGLVHIHKLPAPHTLRPLSDAFSALLGLSASSENNLAFKCMRKRLVFETLHLDLEGGVGERRTTPAANAVARDEAAGPAHAHAGATPGVGEGTKGGGAAAVEVEMEGVRAATATVSITESKVESMAEEKPSSFKKAKPKKKVAFTSDRPDLYDF